MKQIAFNLITFPPKALQTMSCNFRGLNIRMGIAVNEYESGQVITNQPQGIVMILGLNPVCPMPEFPHRGLP